MRRNGQFQSHYIFSTPPAYVMTNSQILITVCKDSLPIETKMLKLYMKFPIVASNEKIINFEGK